jgi:hypothetical protein
VPALAQLIVSVGSVVAGPPGAHPSGSGNGGVSVVGDGGEPSLVVPLLVVAGFVVALVAMVQVWRHLGGWSPAEMTLALQATARELDRVGESVRDLTPESAAAVAHRRAAAALPTVLGRDELSAVHAALAQARELSPFTANSQAGWVERGRDGEPERTA